MKTSAISAPAAGQALRATFNSDIVAATLKAAAAQTGLQPNGATLRPTPAPIPMTMLPDGTFSTSRANALDYDSH